MKILLSLIVEIVDDKERQHFEILFYHIDPYQEGLRNWDTWELRIKEYFDDQERIALYVHLSEMVDEQILGFLNEVYYFVEQKLITKEIIADKIHYLTRFKGVRF